MLILTVQSSRDYVLRMIRAGARGYVLKDAAPDDLPTDRLLALFQAHQMLGEAGVVLPAWAEGAAVERRLQRAIFTERPARSPASWPSK